jgi:hypothetical protein
MPKGGAPRSWVKKYGSTVANQKFEVVKQKMLSAPRRGGRARMGRKEIRRQLSQAKKAIDNAIRSRNAFTIRTVVNDTIGRTGYVANLSKSRGPRMPRGLGIGMLAALNAGPSFKPEPRENFDGKGVYSNMEGKRSYKSTTAPSSTVRNVRAGPTTTAKRTKRAPVLTSGFSEKELV